MGFRGLHALKIFLNRRLLTYDKMHINLYELIRNIRNIEICTDMINLISHLCIHCEQSLITRQVIWKLNKLHLFDIPISPAIIWFGYKTSWSTKTLGIITLAATEESLGDYIILLSVDTHRYIQNSHSLWGHLAYC